nr:penicillin-binding transpeptidase domain-containing protein [Glycomyces sp. L485]
MCYYGAATPHPPASVFDMVTAAAAIENGTAPDSKWSDGDESVTLADAVRESRQDAITEVAEAQGAQAVLDTAAALGLSEMTDEFGTVHDFGQGIDYSAFDTAAFGRYPVSAVDMAAVYATIAADGLRADTHFIERVLVGDDMVQADQGIRTAQAVSADTAGGLQAIGIGHGDAIEGRDFFGLSGAWPDDPPQSWYVGAIPQLSVAAWIGEAGSSDADTAGMPVWRQVVDTAIEVMDYEPESWDGGSGGGESPSGEEPSSQEPTSEEPSEEEPSSGEPTTQEPPDEPNDPPADPTPDDPPPDDPPPDEPSEDPPTSDDCWFVC